MTRAPARKTPIGTDDPHCMKKQSTRGEKVLAFIEKYCFCPEGDHIGQPIRLEPFQRKFILDIYDNPHGTHSAYLSIARKNGKTALIGSILLAHLCGPEAVQNSQIISGAQSKDQAAVVFELARKMVEMSPDAQRALPGTGSRRKDRARPVTDPGDSG
jgi:phage terminase large subunit-like protein